MINLEEHLKTVPADERAMAKSAALSSLPVGNYGGYEVEKISQVGRALKVIIKGQGKRNPFFFYNPPILVPDPHGKIVRVLKDEHGINTVRKYTEDHAAALGEILQHTISTLK